MYPKMRRKLSGEFIASDRGNGVWRLDSGAPRDISVYVQNAQQHPAPLFGAPPISDLDIVWQAGGAQLSFVSGGQPRTVEAAGAIIHEPLGRLYAGLPLPQIDENARRFWRRVFRLVRLPGGRFLLGWLRRAGKH